MSFDLVCLESQPVLSTDLIDFFLSSPKSWEAWSEGSCICFYPDLSLVIKHWANWANSISQYKKRTFYLITCNNFAMQDFNTKLYLSVNTQLCYQIIQIQMKSFFLPDWKNIVKKKLFQSYHPFQSVTAYLWTLPSGPSSSCRTQWRSWWRGARPPLGTRPGSAPSTAAILTWRRYKDTQEYWKPQNVRIYSFYRE